MFSPLEITSFHSPAERTNWFYLFSFELLCILSSSCRPTDVYIEHHLSLHFSSPHIWFVRNLKLGRKTFFISECASLYIPTHYRFQEALNKQRLEAVRFPINWRHFDKQEWALKQYFFTSSEFKITPILAIFCCHCVNLLSKGRVVNFVSYS